VNRTKFRNQALFLAVVLAFVAVGRASAQEQLTRPLTDSRADAPTVSAMPGSAIDSARARYQEADRSLREIAASLRNRARPADDSPNEARITPADRASIRQAVARAFKARQELLRLELVEFEGRLERLKARFGDRERSREKIIDRRVEELLDPNVRWEPALRDEAGLADNDAEPIFDGIPYSQWLETLERERNPRKLFDAVKALRNVPNERDALRLARGYFRALRMLPFEGMSLNEIDDAPETLSAILALQALPARAVVDALIGEIREGRRFVGSRMGVSWILQSALGEEPPGLLAFGYLGDELTRRAAEVLQAFVANKELDSGFGIALVLLKRAGRKPADVEGLAAFLTAGLERAQRLEDGYYLTSELTQIAEIDPDFPAVVDAIPGIVERLRAHWEATLKATDEAVRLTPANARKGDKFGTVREQIQFSCRELAQYLGRFGPAARKALPLLLEIAATEWPNTKPFANVTQDEREDFKQTVAEAIAKIEASPKPDPSASTSGPPGKSAETTFDGVEYSRWLKMLEIERKPEKLAAAMDACARLAVAGDEPRIARGIFRAAKLFEAADAKEQNAVWVAGWTALNRLPALVVVDELIVVLHNGAGTSGRLFPARFAAEKMADSLFEASTSRASQLIDELVKLASKDEANAGWFVAAASTVWRHSDRPLKDFEGLEPLILGMIENGFTLRIQGYTEIVRREWTIVATNVVEKAPEMPELARMLMTHARASTTVLGLIGKMGRHAEAVVPQLVDQFLAQWKKYEMQIREEARLDDPNDRPQQSHEEQILAHWRRVFPLKTLGEIGVGPEGYAILRDLKAISPPRREWNQYVAALPGLFETVETAFARFSPPDASSSIPALLGDFWFISGKWKLRTLIPGETPPDIVAEIRRNYFSWGQNQSVFAVMKSIGSPIGATSMELDETKNPKQITLIYKGGDGQNVRPYRGEGIYELAGNHLEIELAMPGMPRPKEFSPDKDKPPEGRVVLQFDRERPLAGSRE
jgi:uncharacterized protein (TIGR03067 family)